MTTGQKILKLREINEWSQGELARRTDIFYTRFSKWEDDKGKPNWSQLSRIATAFGVSVEYLIDDAREEISGRAERQVWAIVREIGFAEALRRLTRGEPG